MLIHDFNRADMKRLAQINRFLKENYKLSLDTDAEVDSLEETSEVLKKRIIEQGLPEQNYWWYLDLRRYGSTPHAGFGLGFERMIMYLTGIKNIRDVIPFPRTPGSAEF